MEITKEIQFFIIGSKLKSLNKVVEYYKNSFLPDIYDYSGRSQQQHYESALKKLNEFHRDVKDFKKHGRFDLLKIGETEMLNYVRLFAIQKREQADDFKYNPLIKIPNLKKCIKALNLLKQLKPQLEIYSNHWLSTRNEILLN
jgi:hypothetical protein